MDLILYKMLLVMLLYLTYYPIQLVMSQTVQSPVNQSACAGGTVNFTCVVVFTSESPDPANWFTNSGRNDASRLPGHTLTDDTDGRSVPANVTNVLTVTNVSISDNGSDYICTQGIHVISDAAFLTVFGPPDVITDINISPDTTTACSFVVQWSKPSSDPLCGSVWYTVTISTEGGMLIITDNTIMTNYNVTGLDDNTVYHVTVIASNNAGSSNVASMMIMTNSNGLPSNPPNITVSPLSNSSFTVNWTISDPNYSYTVIWTNLTTGMVNSSTVAENTNSYTVTGLSDNDNYDVSITAKGICGIMTSNPITVYDPPNQPQFDYCMSYNNGQPALQMISHVTVDAPRTSLSLAFSASYQTGSSYNQSATCSLLSDMQYNCTAEFAVDIIPSVDAIESVNVTVSGPYGSASSLKSVSLGVNAILSVEMDVTENSATLIYELPCFSPGLQCVTSYFTTNDMDFNMNNITSDITDTVMTYSYQTRTITLSGLNSGTTYNYCVGVTNTTNMMEIGESVCGNFTTQTKGSNGDLCVHCYYIAIIAAIVIVIIVAVIVLLYWRCNGRRPNKVICFRDETVLVSPKSPSKDHPLGNNQAYGITSYDDKKNTSAETRMQENLINDGTIKDDRIDSAAANNVQPTKDTWYDKLASDDDKTKKSDDGSPATTERQEVSERPHQPVNDSVQPHPFYKAEEASRAQLEQQSLVSAAINQNEVPARSSEESTSLQTTATVTNSSTAKRPPVTPINLYDPIQQYPPVIPHLNTNSGDRYALPSPKLGRASKHTDNSDNTKKEIPPYATPDKSKKTANQKQLPAYAVPDKSKKASNKKTKYTDLDVLPSPTSDDTKPLTVQKTKYTEVEIPSPVSEQTPVHEGSV